MSLQGSLDTFALPDVLVLLASTKKTGELHVAGNRSPGGSRTGELQGLMWVDDGRLVGYDVARATDPATALFELLRLAEGSFSFVTGTAPNPQDPVDIEAVLGEAQGYLNEWREIERVVPSLSAWMKLASEAPAAHVSMRAEQWRLIVAVGGGCDVAGLVEQLGQGELAGCRAVKELAEAGLIQVSLRDRAEPVASEPAPSVAPAPTLEPVGSGSGSSDPVLDGGIATFEPTSALRDLADEVAEPTDLDGTEPAEQAPTGLDDLVTLPAAANKAPALAAEQAESLDTYAGPRRLNKPVLGGPAQAADPEAGSRRDPQILARQLASLGDEPGEGEPAQAPAATATAEGEAAEGLDGDEPLNRGLLLKFLSSVRN